ncbi:MAG TPA: tetratricopeptide repeat protein [Candidatus Sulfotelmatobacter sp.]|jgi:tetratricopeptide (TPR) repeat protein|nr:tetratricopeptide repeat protein [Candidatus Sulfotelmatobacter sp.]
MGATDRFSPENVQRILGLTAKQLDYWDRLRLVSPQKEQETRFYDFRDLIGLRTVKQLVEEGVPANRLRRALAALREKLVQVQAPLTELRILSDGKDVLVERHGTRLEPLSGQFVLNFETRDLDEKVRVIAERNADEWLALALEYEADKKTRTEAMDAYDRALRVDPAKIDALLNCGTLHYENGNFEKASEYFGRAISAQPDSALAHFNLGSVLEEMGDVDTARKHLRQAVRLDPDYPDAQYNLAYVCEKLGAFAEGREHWQAYLKLDPVGPWSNYARQRLSSSVQAKSAGNI